MPEWADGTAIYYWLQHEVYGAPDWARPAVDVLVGSPAVVTAVTWGTVALELALAAGLLADRRWWRPLLIGGLLLHLGIGVLQGLASFSLIMVAALVLYLRPLAQPFPRRLRLPRLGRWAPAREEQPSAVVRG